MIIGDYKKKRLFICGKSMSERKNMILKNGTFEELADEVRRKNLRIVIFGAGMIGTVTTPSILQQYQIEQFVDFYVDNDKDKWGKTVSLATWTKTVYSVDCLKECSGEDCIVLLTISRFGEILHQLENIQNLNRTVCYLIPMMCITNFKNKGKNAVRKDYALPVIPKVIHYMWLGKHEIPLFLQHCIDSWKKNCPEYEIRCWNETNYDVNKNLYMAQAYSCGMYGFVPDYARLDILYNYGGIYVDTDIELIKSLDDMLYQSAFCNAEKWQTINFGGCSGAIKGNEAIGRLLEAREELSFIDANGNINKNTCGYYDTLTLKKYGYVLDGTVQRVMDINIYPYEYFHPYDYMSGRTECTGNTHGIHHFNGGWLDEKMKKENRKTAEEFEKVFQAANFNRKSVQ